MPSSKPCANLMAAHATRPAASRSVAFPRRGLWRPESSGISETPACQSRHRSTARWLSCRCPGVQDDLAGETFRPPIQPYLAVQRYDHPLHDLHPEAPARRFGNGRSTSLRPVENQPSVRRHRPVDVDAAARQRQGAVFRCISRQFMQTTAIAWAASGCSMTLAPSTTARFRRPGNMAKAPARPRFAGPLPPISFRRRARGREPAPGCGRRWPPSDRPACRPA